MITKARLLIIDDEETIRVVLSDSLEAEGYQTAEAGSAAEAMALCSAQQFDLALVDLRIPGDMDGLEFTSWLKENHPGVDVIILTAYATLETSLVALRQGAYDYLIKPVSISQVINTVGRCIEKRTSEHQRQMIIDQIESLLGQLKLQDDSSGRNLIATGQILKRGAVIIDRQKRLVVCKGQPLELTPTEFDLLEYLMVNSERVVSASELARAVQGYEIGDEEARPIVRVNIRRLRQKIEPNPDQPLYVQTVRKAGYRFATVE